MRYFTEKWYKDTILAEMCFQIKKTSRAAKHSESFFEYLYKSQKKWFVNNQKHFAKYTKTPFDREAAEAAYEANYNENLEYVKANIPAEILEKVADIRVLSMGSATSDVTDEITKFCGKINRQCEAVTEDYDEEVEALANTIGWYKINLLNALSNAVLAEVAEGNEGFVIRTSEENTDFACTVILKDAKVSECHEKLVGATILCFEILPTESADTLELNLLCLTDGDEYVTFSATASDIEFPEN